VSKRFRLSDVGGLGLYIGHMLRLELGEYISFGERDLKYPVLGRSSGEMVRQIAGCH
jgi:hypothetical protein